MSRPLREFKVLTLDCYGTMIDWESGIWDMLQPMIAANALDTVSRQDALKAYAQCEHRLEAQSPRDPYNRILARAHAAVTEMLGGKPDADMDTAFGESVPYWPAFPDSASALRELKKHFRLVALTNVHREGFAQSALRLGVTFDAVYTAEDIGSYKPSAANFAYLLHHLELDFGLTRNDILHTAQSLFHDHVPANAFGLANAWIDRQNQRSSGDTGLFAVGDAIPDTMYVFSSLRELADAVAAESD